jgi:hypothetical protein
MIAKTANDEPGGESDLNGLSVDEAAELLAAGPSHDRARAEASDADERSEATGDDADDDDEAPLRAVTIKPPHSWDAEAKARFQELPEDVQELISERESERDRATSRAMQDAAEARKRAESDAAEASAMTDALDQLIPQAAQAFAGKWGEVDWQAWAAEDPQAALEGRLAFEAEQAEMERLQFVQQQAEVLSHHRYVAREAERLKDLAPELADPKAGPGRRQALGRYLMGLGVSEQQLSQLSAVEAAVAYDAMRWREAQAGLAKGETPARARTVRPSGAVAERSGPRGAKEALARLSRSGSVDDAVAYLRQRG